MNTFIVIFCAFFALSYYIILHSRFHELFKQGKVREIKVAQLLLSFIIAYLAASGLLTIIDNIIYNVNI